MSNRTVTISSLSTDSLFVFETYQIITETRIYFSSLTLLVYASILYFADEFEYIWKRKITLPTILYMCSKYPLFVGQAIEIVLNFTAESSRLCNDLGIFYRVINVFPVVGVQGLIALRTYALCRGFRPMMIALFITFLFPVAISIYDLAHILFLLRGVAVILLDILAFIGVSYQVLRLWKSKRSLQSSENLTMALFRQGIVRFSFVILFTSATTLLMFFASPLVANPISAFQNVISALLICEFTVDLRRRGTKVSVADQPPAMLPTSSFQNSSAQPLQPVAGRIHESIVTEMGEIDDSTVVDSISLHSLKQDDRQNDT